MSQQFTPADVAQHNNPEKGLYIIVDSNVYNVTGKPYHACPTTKSPGVLNTTTLAPYLLSLADIPYRLRR